MDSFAKSGIKAKSIIKTINAIKRMEYDSLNYDVDKWELGFNLYPHNLSFSIYSRIYVFNNQLDTLVNKMVGQNFKLFSAEELEYGVTTDLRTFLVLKYPYSEVPELDETFL